MNALCVCGALILLVSTSLQGCRMRGFHANVHLRNPIRAPDNATNKTNATNLTNTTVPKGPVGVDVDEHGCKTSAGLAWCEAEGSCLPPGQPCASVGIPEGGSVGAGGVILDASDQPLVG